MSNRFADMNPTFAFNQWKDSDAKAREKEAELKRAWEAHDKGGADVPSPELLDEVSQLRTIAQDKLTQALRAMRSQPNQGLSGTTEHPESL
jgi:hypothetical protein